jgi:very-short-patch-repair endonuclease
MNVRVVELAAEQYDIVATWQLRADGASRRMIEHWVEQHGWRVVHPGVYALTAAPLTRHQRWMAATLTAPDSFLSHASAAACWGTRPFDGAFEVIVRHGSGGPKRHGGVLVTRSLTLDGDVTRHEGIPITTPERTDIDLAAHLDEAETARLVRESIRLERTTAPALLEAVDRRPQGRGTRLVRDLATRYAEIPYRRTRSDAEWRALEILSELGARPEVNVRIAGEEADLVDRERRAIVEIDGPQYHRFPDQDERKERRWEEAGFTVRRLPSGAVYGSGA